jgi:hypothetical protein
MSNFQYFKNFSRSQAICGALVLLLALAVFAVPSQAASPDINGDGVVNLSDIAIFASLYPGPYDARIDFNGDGVINLTDLSIFASYF